MFPWTLNVVPSNNKFSSAVPVPSPSAVITLSAASPVNAITPLVPLVPEEPDDPLVPDVPLDPEDPLVPLVPDVPDVVLELDIKKQRMVINPIPGLI